MCVSITQDVFNYLLKHMLDIHDQKMSLVSSYSIEYDAYMKMLSTIKEYINRIEKFLETAVIQDGSNDLPFVMFGCCVYLSAVDTAETISCSIVLPNDARSGKTEHDGVKLIPCCSADADALLYKCVGDSVTLEAPGTAKKRWAVKRIEQAANASVFNV